MSLKETFNKNSRDKDNHCETARWEARVLLRVEKQILFKQKLCSRPVAAKRTLDRQDQLDILIDLMVSLV